MLRVLPYHKLFFRSLSHITKNWTKLLNLRFINTEHFHPSQNFYCMFLYKYILHYSNMFWTLKKNINFLFTLWGFLGDFYEGFFHGIILWTKSRYFIFSKYFQWWDFFWYNVYNCCFEKSNGCISHGVPFRSERFHLF